MNGADIMVQEEKAPWRWAKGDIMMQHIDPRSREYQSQSKPLMSLR